MKITKIVDLSLQLQDDTPIYPGDPQPKINVATTLDQDGYNLFEIVVGSQSGSHVDAPYHFSNDGKRVDEMDLSMFWGQAVLFDVSYKKENEPILLADIEATLGEIQGETIALFRTDWYKTAGSELFFGHPYVSKEVAEYLVANGITFLGIDTINADQTGGTEFPVHDLFSEKSLMIGENWANFDKILEEPFYIAAFPLKWHCDGSPVRPVAIHYQE